MIRKLAAAVLLAFLATSPAFAADTLSASPNPCTPSGSSRYCQTTVTWSASTSYPYYSLWILSPLVIDGSARQLVWPGAMWKCGSEASGSFVATLVTSTAASVVLAGSTAPCGTAPLARNVNQLATAYLYSN